MARTNALIGNETITLSLGNNESATVPDGRGFSSDLSTGVPLASQINSDSIRTTAPNGHFLYDTGSNYAGFLQTDSNGELNQAYHYVGGAKSLEFADNGDLLLTTNGFTRLTPSSEVVFHTGGRVKTERIDASDGYNGFDGNGSTLRFLDGGTRVLTCGDNTKLTEYELPAPYTLTGATQTAESNVNSTEYGELILVNDDETKLVIFNTSRVYEYEYGTAGDITTLTETNSRQLENIMGTSRGADSVARAGDNETITVLEDGYYGDGDMYTLTFGTPYDISTLTSDYNFHAKNYTANTFDRFEGGLVWIKDGQELIYYYEDNGNDEFEIRLSVSTPFDADTVDTKVSETKRNEYGVVTTALENGAYVMYEDSYLHFVLYPTVDSPSDFSSLGQSKLGNYITELDDGRLVVVDRSIDDLWSLDGQTGEVLDDMFLYQNDSRCVQNVGGTGEILVMDDYEIHLYDYNGNRLGGTGGIVGNATGTQSPMVVYDSPSVTGKSLVYPNPTNQTLYQTDIFSIRQNIEASVEYNPSAVSSSFDTVYYVDEDRFAIPYSGSDTVVEVDVSSRSVESMFTPTPSTITRFVGITPTNGIVFFSDRRINVVEDWFGIKAYQATIAVDTANSQYKLKGQRMYNNSQNSGSSTQKMMLTTGDKIESETDPGIVVSLKRIK